MTPVQRVHRARMMLTSAVLVTVVLWAAAAGMAALMLVAFANAAGMAPGGVVTVEALAAAAVLALLALLLWKGRAVWSAGRVALWLEERAPELKYALVTVVDPRYAPSPIAGEGHAALLRTADRVDVEGIVRRSAARAIARAVAAAVAMGGLASLVQATTTLDPLHRAVGAARTAKPLGNRLVAVRAEVTPPTYSGLPRKVIDEPVAVAGLYGTRIRFVGAGVPEGVVAIVPRDTIIRDTVAAVAAARGWAITVPMPKIPGVLRFEDRQYNRSVSLEPLPDSAPHVVLREPARDTTWRWDHPPSGELVLEAAIEDDYGVSSAFFEILVSTGSAENFETKDKSTARVAFGGQRIGTLRTTLNYRDLQVKPGTVLHIRAVAFDNNTAADSVGRGISETRTLRVGTKEESDSVDVPPAPPLPIDSFFVSQRLLNMQTDTLVRIKRKSLNGEQLYDTSARYATRQETIRGRVEKVITIVEDDGVGGRIETDLSRLLRAAATEMYGAFVDLSLGQPDTAYVPPKSHMKEALRLLDEARKAQKYYVRGGLKVKPVNVAAARLQATDSSAKAAPRTPRAIPEDVRRELRERLAAIIPMAMQSSAAAMEPLLNLKSTALRRGATEVATALQVAIDAASKNKPAVAALARVRRLLEPRPWLTKGPTEWGGGVLQ